VKLKRADATQGVPTRVRSFGVRRAAKARAFEYARACRDAIISVRFCKILICALFAVLFLSLASPTQAQRRTPTPTTPPPTATASTSATPSAPQQALPSPLCALTGSVLTCYEPRRARATVISGKDEAVADFALSPDGGWAIYRADASLWMVSLDGAQRATIDRDAAPPASSEGAAQSIAWSPDALGLAYTTAGGLRTLYPAGGSASQNDRPYTSLRWSPDGARLAAQASDGGWTFLESKPGALRVLRRFTDAADVAWVDESSVVVAPIAGGLLRLNVTAASDTPPIWYIADETFIKLRSGEPGEVLALNPLAGTTLGRAVSISADGKWQPLGSARLDSRVEWGPDPGKLMYYITSGTPILVDRATGYEDMLPVRDASRVVFGALAAPEVAGVSMDADLYFLAADRMGVAQLWRLPRNGAALTQLSRTFSPVSAYAVQSDKIAYTTNAGTILVNLDGSIPDVATPDAGLLVTQTPRPVPTAVPVELKNVGWQPGPSVVQRAGGKAASIDEPLGSLTGRYAAGMLGAERALVVLDWTTGKLVRIRGIMGATALRWVG